MVSQTPGDCAKYDTTYSHCLAKIGEWGGRGLTTLRGNYTTFTKSSEQELEVWPLEERLGRAFGIARIGDDHVELVLTFLEVLEAVADVDRDVGVLESDCHTA